MKSAFAEGVPQVAPLDAAVVAELAPLWWPIERLAEGLDLLARRAGLASADAAPVVGKPPVGDPARWLAWACEQTGIETEAVDAAVPEVASLLRAAGPAIVPHWQAHRRGFFLVLAARGNALNMIGPDHATRHCALASLRAALCWRQEAPLRPQVEAIIAAARLPAARRERAIEGLLVERLATVRIEPVWMLRLPSGAPWRRQLAHARLGRRLTTMVALFAVGYVFELVGWALIGRAVLDGRFDAGWFAAWFVLLLTTVPLRLLAHALDATFALGVGRLLKARLLAGALKMDLEVVRGQGAGHLLGRVIESQALEGLALAGGLSGLVALLELGFAGWLLAAGAGGLAHAALLVVGTAVALVLALRYARHLERWTRARLDQTHALIERMVGHRTMLAQDRPERREVEDDRALDGYLLASNAMDRAIVPVLAGVPAGWLFVGLAGLVPAFVAGGATSSALAIGVGGVLFAQRAFGTLGGSLAAIARAAVAWKQVGALNAAAATRIERRPFVPARDDARGPLIDARGLAFGYRADRRVIDDADLVIARGDRVLLGGASGGGKSTLAALLTGLRRPDAGLLLLDGLDRATHGDEWHRLATAAPQFHENHVLSGTVAFNLLMGRDGASAAVDLAEAAELCEALGLGELLRRMPAGLQQRVGETGWQLSHGERSRLFLARALLQDAELTVLDESFAALDPETLARCLRVATARAKTLVVIAHP